MNRFTMIMFSLLFVIISFPCFAAGEELSSGWQILFTILQFATPLIVAGALWLIGYIIKWIKSNIDNKLFQQILTRLLETVSTLVKEAEQTFVKELKAAKDPNSPGGEKLTKAEAKHIKDKVLEKFKLLWGPKGLAELAKILGCNTQQAEEFVGSKIEAQLYDMK